MPELPEVETVMQAIVKAVAYANIIDVKVNNNRFREKIPDDLAAKICGAKIIGYKRIAKYITINLDNGLTLIWHLGMSGKIKICDELPQVLDKHDHVIIKTDKCYLIFNDTRRFGLLTYCESQKLNQVPFIAKIGLDPFDENLTPDYLYNHLSKKKIPIKVALGGVMPVIFASSILSIPSTIEMFWQPTGIWAGFFAAFRADGWAYALLYFLLILMFAYFYTSIQYNPVEMANNLKQNNGTIPGIRPGTPTAEFIRKILSRITLIGALFLAFIALVPIIYSSVTGLRGLTMGGTSVIIMVGVALETVKQLESQMMMRHYKGFLD